MSQIKFNFCEDSKIVYGVQDAYQRTRVNGKQLPKNFVYVIHDNEPMLLLENRDKLSYDKDAMNNHINCVFSGIYYKKATLYKHRTGKPFTAYSKTHVPNLVVEYNGSYVIPPGTMFHVNEKGVVIQEPFNETDKEVYYTTDSFSKEFLEYSKTNPMLLDEIKRKKQH